MAFKKDSVAGTMVFIIILSLVCSFMITGTVEILKERKLAKKREEVQQFVLKAADIDISQGDFSELFAQRVKPKMVNLATGKVTEKANLLDLIPFIARCLSFSKLPSLLTMATRQCPSSLCKPCFRFSISVSRSCAA